MCSCKNLSLLKNHSCLEVWYPPLPEGGDFRYLLYCVLILSIFFFTSASVKHRQLKNDNVEWMPVIVCLFVCFLHSIKKRMLHLWKQLQVASAVHGLNSDWQRTLIFDIVQTKYKPFQTISLFASMRRTITFVFSIIKWLLQQTYNKLTVHFFCTVWSMMYRKLVSCRVWWPLI